MLLVSALEPDYCKTRNPSPILVRHYLQGSRSFDIRESLDSCPCYKQVENLHEWTHFVSQIGHHSVKFLLDQQHHIALQQKWCSHLLGSDCEIQSKKGVDNIVADALSRIAESLHQISNSIPKWITEVHDSLNDDSTTYALVSQLLLDPLTTLAHNTYHQGLLCS